MLCFLTTSFILRWWSPVLCASSSHVVVLPTPGVPVLHDVQYKAFGYELGQIYMMMFGSRRDMVAKRWADVLNCASILVAGLGPCQRLRLR